MPHTLLLPFPHIFRPSDIPGEDQLLWPLHLYAVFEYQSVCKALLSDMHKLQRQPFKD